MQINRDITRGRRRDAYPILLEAGGPRPAVPIIEPPVQGYTDGNDPEAANYVGDINTDAVYPEDDAEYDPHEWAYIHLDAHHQFTQADFNRPLGTNWFLSILGVTSSNVELSPALKAMSCYTRDQIVQLFAIGYVITTSASTTVLQSFGIEGGILDAYYRRQNHQFFTTIWRGIADAPYVGTRSDVPYFRFVSTVIQFLTGYDHQIMHQHRVFNNGLTYGAAHNDRYGVYHLLTGNLPLRQVSVLCINEFIISRPREWGIFTPTPTGSIRDCFSRIYSNMGPEVLVTHAGHRGYIDRYQMPILRSSSMSFCQLMINAITSTIFRMADYADMYRYYSAVSARGPTNLVWQPIDVHNMPMPIPLPQLGIMEPATIRCFDWYTASYLAICLEVGQENRAMLSILGFNDNCSFIGAGITLPRTLGQPAALMMQEPQAVMLPWQNNADIAPPLVDAYNVPNIVWDAASRPTSGHQTTSTSTPNAPSSSSGQKPAPTEQSVVLNSDISNSAGANLQIQLCTVPAKQGPDPGVAPAPASKIPVKSNAAAPVAEKSSVAPIASAPAVPINAAPAPDAANAVRPRETYPMQPNTVFEHIDTIGGNPLRLTSDVDSICMTLH